MISDKKREKAAQEAEQVAQRAFNADIEAVYEKHGRCIIAMMNYSHKGIIAELGIGKLPPKLAAKESVA